MLHSPNDRTDDPRYVMSLVVLVLRCSRATGSVGRGVVIQRPIAEDIIFWREDRSSPGRVTFSNNSGFGHSGLVTIKGGIEAIHRMGIKALVSERFVNIECIEVDR